LLDSLVLGPLPHDGPVPAAVPLNVDAGLEQAVGQALEQAQAAVAGGALLEVVHWELERGLEVCAGLSPCCFV
jgi:hypothetical protein